MVEGIKSYQWNIRDVFGGVISDKSVVGDDGGKDVWDVVEEY